MNIDKKESTHTTSTNRKPIHHLFDDDAMCRYNSISLHKKMIERFHNSAPHHTKHNSSEPWIVPPIPCNDQEVARGENAWR